MHVKNSLPSNHPSIDSADGLPSEHTEARETGEKSLRWQSWSALAQETGPPEPSRASGAVDEDSARGNVRLATPRLSESAAASVGRRQPDTAYAHQSIFIRPSVGPRRTARLAGDYMTTSASGDHDDPRSEPQRKVSGDGYDLRAPFASDDEPLGRIDAISSDEDMRDDPSISGDGFELVDSSASSIESDLQTGRDVKAEFEMPRWFIEEDDVGEDGMEPESGSVRAERTTYEEVELPTDNTFGAEEQLLFNTLPEDRPASLDRPLLDPPNEPGGEFRRKLRLASESTVEIGRPLVSDDSREPASPPLGPSEISTERMPAPQDIFAHEADPIPNNDAESSEEAVWEFGSEYHDDAPAVIKPALGRSIENASEGIGSDLDVEEDAMEVDFDAYEYDDLDNDNIGEFALADFEDPDPGASGDLDEDAPADFGVDKPGIQDYNTVQRSEDTISWERELTETRPTEGERDNRLFRRVEPPESRKDADDYADLHPREDPDVDSAIREGGSDDSAIHEDTYPDSEISGDGSVDSSIREDSSIDPDIPEESYEDSYEPDGVHPDTDRQGGAHSDIGGPAPIRLGVEMREPYEAPESADVDELLSEFVESEDQGTAAGDAVPVAAQHLRDNAGGNARSEGYSLLDLQDRVVIMLLFKQLVRVEDVELAWREWNEQSGGPSKEPLWRYMTSDPSFDRNIIFAEAAQVYAFTEATIDEQRALQILKSFKESVDESLFQRMRSLRVIPVRRERKQNSKHSRVLFVSHDPTRPEVHRLLRELKGQSYEMQYAPEAVIEDLISKAFPARNEYLERVSDSEMAYDLGTSYDLDDELIDEDALEAEIGRSTLINLFEASLVEAVRRDVSDIHIFPNPRKQIEIHFRINGELECWHRDDRIHPEAFLAVVKDNSLNVDRFERDAAQDGFIQRKIDDTLIRFRVSVLPVANANQEIRSESIVIRVLDDRKVITDLGRLGLLESARKKFEWAISQPHGMVILTGPTGSGKTTTLFAALSQVVTPKLNVLTVEDPVEYVIPGVRQVKLSHKLNLEQALRAILRHDPDVVMVGEMRDRQTADLAIKLANTGHLTFSTLHTNDAPSAISRLYKMGVEPFLIAYAINLVVAQRLVRVLCRICKKPLESFDEPMLARLGFTTDDLARAEFFEEGHDPSCRACGGSGYRGRRAITETMAFSNEIRRQIVLAQNMIDEDTIRRLAESEGMLSLRASAREVVVQGETSVSELVRVTASEN